MKTFKFSFHNIFKRRITFKNYDSLYIFYCVNVANKLKYNKMKRSEVKSHDKVNFCKNFGTIENKQLI